MGKRDAEWVGLEMVGLVYMGCMGDSDIRRVVFGFVGGLPKIDSKMYILVKHRKETYFLTAKPTDPISKLLASLSSITKLDPKHIKLLLPTSQGIEPHPHSSERVETGIYDFGGKVNGASERDRRRYAIPNEGMVVYMVFDREGWEQVQVVEYDPL